MILGVGTDIVEIERVREAIGRWGDKFLKRIFSEREISYCYSRRDPYPHLSARFAAKEAAVKALSDAVKESHLHISDFEVRSQTSGKPYIVTTEKYSDVIRNIILHLTISHERNYSVAVVIAERLD